MLRNKVVTAGMIGALVVGGSVLTAVPATAAGSCSSNRFCGFSSTNYNGSKIVNSAASSGTVDVADNELSSAKNNRSKEWCAVNVEVGINIVRFRFGAHTANSTMAPYNDVTDFLWVKGSGTC